MLTESINVSTRAKLFMMTIPVCLEASVTKPLGLKPMQGVIVLVYSSWLRISLPPSKLLIQRGSPVCAIFTNSSIAAKASSRTIDLSIDLLSKPEGVTNAVVVGLVLEGDTMAKGLDIPTPKSGIVEGTVLQ